MGDILVIALEGAIELRDRLEAGLEGDLRSRGGGDFAGGAWPFHASAGKVVSKSNACRLFKDLAKVAGAGVDSLGSLVERNTLLETLANVFLSAADYGRFGLSDFRLDTIADGSEVLGKSSQQVKHSFVLLLIKDLRLEISLFERLEVDLAPPMLGADAWYG